MFRRKTGIHPAVLVLGSAALTLAFSPELRKRVTGMFAGRMGGQRQNNSAKNMMMNPADFIKQAFTQGNQMQSNQGSTQNQYSTAISQGASGQMANSHTNAAHHHGQAQSHTNHMH